LIPALQPPALHLDRFEQPAQAPGLFVNSGKPASKVMKEEG
jgi:hypothetical protein